MDNTDRDSDLARLPLGLWANRDIREAFLSGYGLQSSGIDRQMLGGCAVLAAARLMIRARETRQGSSGTRAGRRC